MFDKMQFKKVVSGAGLTMKDVAIKLDIDLSTLYRKMNGQSDFFRNEIITLCEILHIENPHEIFFA